VDSTGEQWSLSDRCNMQLSVNTNVTCTVKYTVGEKFFMCNIK
jgi:hypothetical protein